MQKGSSVTKKLTACDVAVVEEGNSGALQHVG